MARPSTALAQTRIGTTVAGKYRLQRLLGAGAMGAVYAALHQFTSKQVALKLIDASFAENEGFAPRFLREARAAAEIRHPTICDVLDAGQEPDGSVYLVLELLEGRTLDDGIEAKDLKVDEIVEVGVQLCEGLAAAHDSGIVHRDIKPENIFLTWDEKGELRVKLLDFGVAKRTKGAPELFSTAQGAILGTPYYMAPEQAAGDPVDARADIWSAGAVLFHALTGRPPFDEETYNRLIAKLIGSTPPRLRELRPDLPDWLGTAVDGALSRTVEDRWQSARTMGETLRLRGGGAIDLDWELHEDQTVRSEGVYDPSDDQAPALAALSSHEIPNIEVDLDAEPPGEDRTIRAEPITGEIAMLAVPPKRGRSGPLLLGLVLGFGIAALAALAAGWFFYTQLLSP